MIQNQTKKGKTHSSRDKGVDITQHIHRKERNGFTFCWLNTKTKQKMCFFSSERIDRNNWRKKLVAEEWVHTKWTNHTLISCGLYWVSISGVSTVASVSLQPSAMGDSRGHNWVNRQGLELLAGLWGHGFMQSTRLGDRLWPFICRWKSICAYCVIGSIGPILHLLIDEETGLTDGLFGQIPTCDSVSSAYVISFCEFCWRKMNLVRY